MNNIALGNAGEKIACDFLQHAGYKIITQKYRAKTGEIDIIASKGGVTVFVEVKTRRSLLFGTPAQAVSKNKQDKIINTAWCFLQQTGKTNSQFRFDIIEVLLESGEKAECRQIINAFGR